MELVPNYQMGGSHLDLVIDFYARDVNKTKIT